MKQILSSLICMFLICSFISALLSCDGSGDTYETTAAGKDTQATAKTTPRGIVCSELPGNGDGSGFSKGLTLEENRQLISMLEGFRWTEGCPYNEIDFYIILGSSTICDRIIHYTNAEEGGLILSDRSNRVYSTVSGQDAKALNSLLGIEDVQSAKHGRMFPSAISCKAPPDQSGVIKPVKKLTNNDTDELSSMLRALNWEDGNVKCSADLYIIIDEEVILHYTESEGRGVATLNYWSKGKCAELDSEQAEAIERLLGLK